MRLPIATHEEGKVESQKLNGVKGRTIERLVIGKYSPRRIGSSNSNRSAGNDSPGYSCKFEGSTDLFFADLFAQVRSSTTWVTSGYSTVRVRWPGQHFVGCWCSFTLHWVFHFIIDFVGVTLYGFVCICFRFMFWCLLFAGDCMLFCSYVVL